MPRRRIIAIRGVICLFIFLLLGGCATRPPSMEPTSDQNQTHSLRQRIIHAAHNLLGVPYVWGGTSLEGMDCSGLVQYVYGRAGIAVPRTAESQYHRGHPLDEILPGDLLFFETEPSRISHVGIYIGNGQMIHASSGSRRVRKANIDRPYWRQRLVSGATYFSEHLQLAHLSAGN